MKEDNVRGEDFQESTKYIRGKPLPGRMIQSGEPDAFKIYKSCIGVIKLPEPDREGGNSLRSVLNRRRTRRKFSSMPLTLPELSNLLWCHQGLNLNRVGIPLRTAPSAGALFPTETYIIVNNVEGLQRGLYHYLVREHSLEFLKEENLAEEAAGVAADQKFVRNAAVLFVFTSVITRCSRKYLDRAYRFIYLDAGHIGENLHLAATDMNLGACPIAAFYDEEIDKLIGVDGKEETAIYMYAVGNLQGTPFLKL
ncbi:MAG: SagB/ThcOx family dehydrogenase [Firmicutes bacterium]|nr:SagB/ThcOx family dehydrogenase [Bacillota bacterium]